MRYQVQHEKRKSISTSSHLLIIFIDFDISILINDFFDDFPKISELFPKISKVYPKVV